MSKDKQISFQNVYQLALCEKSALFCQQVLIAQTLTASTGTMLRKGFLAKLEKILLK